MLITDEIFCAFLNCETKAYLKSAGDIGTQRAHIEWERSHLNSFKQKSLMNFRCKLGANECLKVCHLSNLSKLMNIVF